MRVTRLGFTLIELLVVVAIVAILAAVLFPVFAHAKAGGKKAASLAHARQVGVAAILYLDDNVDRYPMLQYSGPAGQTVPDNFGFFRWPWLLRPYAKSFDVFLDPADWERPDFRDKNDPNFGYAFGLCPSFGYHARLFSPGAEEYLPDHEPFSPIVASALQAPSETVFLAQSTWFWPLDKPNVGYYRIYPPERWTRQLPASGRTWGHFWPRHFGTHGTVLFADGHVKSMTPSTLDRPGYWDGLGLHTRP
jgi:prepilin-type N-terminal cleavage/methylation domain-containing protein/prepilin-type processing-associated H-X9-DG protein